MKNRFQFILSFSVFVILFLGFFLYFVWVENIVYNNLTKQALDDNLTIGESVFDMFEKADVPVENKEEFLQLVQETCDVLKLPNEGYICLVDSVGNLLAAPGLKADKKVNIASASFRSLNRDESFSFTDFYESKPFTGYYEYEQYDYSDIVVAMNYDVMGYKMLVHQSAKMIKGHAREKSLPLLWGGIVLTVFLSILSYFVTHYQVKKYQFRISAQHAQLAKVNNEIKEKNQALRGKNVILQDLATEKDALLGIMAHDLRNPIGGIESVINLVSLAGELNSEQKEYFSLLKSQVNSAQALIADVLEMNKLENDKAELKKEKVDLVHFLDQKIKDFAPLANKKEIEIVADYNVSENDIETGTNELNRIVDNLLSNSIKYSPIGAQVTVGLKSEKNNLIMSFIDKGKGIKEKEMPMLFKKFTKLSSRPTNEESSCGLGLYIVKLLSQKIGAKVKVESVYEKGSTFSVIVPL